MSRNARSRMGRAIKAAPSFSLDFTRGVLDPRLTFTRASGATFVGSDGLLQTAASNAPRFDYDPVTLAIRGLLIEEARTNLSPTSRAHSPAGGLASLTQNATGSDAASNTAWTATEDLATSTHFATNNGTVTFTSGTAYTLTALIKPGTASKCQLTGASAAFGATQCVNFNLSGAGSVLQVLGGAAGTIKPGPNGFYSCSITITASASAGGTGCVIAFINTDTDARLPNYTGTSRTLIVDHAQAEAGAFPTSIIPTSGAAATRAAEICNAATAGWLNPSEGSIAVDMLLGPDGVESRFLVLDDGTTANRLVMQHLNTNQLSGFGAGFAGSWGLNTTGISAILGHGTRNIVCGSYSTRAGARLTRNGVLGTSPAPVIASAGTALTRMTVGHNNGGTQHNGHIRAVDYYPVALDPQTLRRLTSATEHPSPRRINPDFSLHFLDGVLDSRVTFTRASGGTRINSAGVLVTETTNVPRFDYDPITLACKGLLIEEARTNRCTTSTTVVALSGATTAIDAVNMFGVANAATTLTETLTTGLHYGSVGVNVAWVAGTVYSCTLFLSPGTADRAQLLFTTSGAVSTLNDYANFSLVGAGAVLAVGSSSSASIKRVSANVYACTVLLTSGGTLSAIPILVSHINSDTASRGAANYPGTGLTLVVHGAQVEAGAFPTSYIPTTGAAATRAADVATVTGIGSWFNANEGSAVAEFVPQASSVDAYAAVLSAGTGSSNRIQITARRGSGSTSGFAVVSGGAATVDMVLAANVAGAVTKLAASYKADDFKATINGATLVTDTAGALPATAPDRLTLGSRWAGDGVSALNGHIRHFDYYRQALPADFITELSR